MSILGDERGGFVDCEVYRSPHAGGGRAHGSPQELQEVEVTKNENIVSHDQLHRFLDDICGEPFGDAVAERIKP